VRLLAIVLVLILGSSRLALGWGAEGHRAIAALAQELISRRTRGKAQELLSLCGERDLISASTWADDIRPNRRSERPRPQDADAFNSQFPDNANWHFVNLPLGTASFAEAERFIIGKSDIIDAIERCIAVLETSAPVPGEISRPDALRLLVHFVGDIHQPLHCGTGFYKITETEPPVLVTNPIKVVGLPNDRGGNDLFYGPKDQLHALWDLDMVAAVAGTFDFRFLAAFLRDEYQQGSWPATSGDYHHWAETWALESVKAANLVYAGIRFNSVETMGDPNSLWIGISLPRDYEQENRLLAAHQLTKAAVRLAQLLDRIRWP
jgi:S1/P1 Nuclease